MLALCSMLSDTYYTHNYASIIGGGSLRMSSFVTDLCNNGVLVFHVVHVNHVACCISYEPWLLCDRCIALIYTSPRPQSSEIYCR